MVQLHKGIKKGEWASVATILYTEFGRLPKDSQSPSTTGTPSTGQNISFTSSRLCFIICLWVYDTSGAILLFSFIFKGKRFVRKEVTPGSSQQHISPPEWPPSRPRKSAWEEWPLTWLRHHPSLMCRVATQKTRIDNFKNKLVALSLGLRIYPKAEWYRSLWTVSFVVPC